uniref:Uncharacterized protein n=1 Tax=Panagrolaimus davidi TaxID=227884 RepID=A0A914QB00_9BILA
MNGEKNFQNANVVILKPNFVVKNATFGRADITSLKNNTILPGRENTTEQLVISTRNLTFIENGVFNNFTALKSLSLIGTNLTNITDEVFTKELGATLIELDLSFNEFKLLSSIDFSHLTNLKTLNLHGSKFGKNFSTSPSVFPKSLANLETLILSNCGFEVLNTSIFENLLNLKTLYLSENPLKTMPTAINYLPSLQNLYLETTSIIILNNTGIKMNQNLEKLVLTNSRLERIEDCAFCSFPNIKVLHFWSNLKLSFIDENAFGFAKNGTSPKIESLSFEHCKLEIIPEKLLDWKNIKEIGIGGNNFMCNCSLSWLINGIDNLNLVQLYTHPSEGSRYHYSIYYGFEEIRENNLQCQGPMALNKIHFSIISGNLCKKKSPQHSDSVPPHHVFCYVLCAFIVLLIIFAAISYPIYQLYLRFKKNKTATPFSYENNNFDGDSEANNP